MWKNWRIRRKIIVMFTILLIASNLILFGVFSSFYLIQTPHDADRKSNGNTLIATASFIGMLDTLSRRNTQNPVVPNQSDDKIIEVNPQGRIVWEYKGLGVPHEICELPNGHLLVADTEFDRIIEIDYPQKHIVWSWEPAEINWTEVNPEWGPDHYYNNPLAYDWTHVNDVDIKDYGNWSGCLISLRNFDLIVEVNYTADFLDPNNPKHIIWWYGDYENYTCQRRQHNPDYLSNGNIIVSDSGNNRIIEVNYTIKKIVWKYEGLSWPRDADELPNGNILITDSIGSRVIEITKDTKQIVWSHSQDFLIPYEADLLDNGHILISTAYNGLIIEVNRAGFIVWSYGISYIRSLLYMNAFILIGLSSLVLYYKSKYMKKFSSFTRKQKIVNMIIAILFTSFLIIGVLLLIFYSQFLAYLVNIVYNIFGVDLF